MFTKILIANRGEIACRVIRTARRLGISTVAVYSDADADALHVAMADEAYRIGPAAPRDSYLNVAAILEAARRSGAQALHPGYGFLSENAAFAEACAASGVVFIGPPPAAIRAMGGKSEAKALMERAGVPLVPGYHGAAQDDATLVAAAARIGFPVLIKASAGGGGKGMRVVEAEADLSAAIAAARREALSSFGDDRVLIERYLTRPRHIEIQVFADTHGNAVSLFERDCSIQRRHQKIIEEAPAPGMTAAMRRAMGEAAVAATKAVGYVGAGTVEFIVEGTDFHFMEMNTRLQVEHPVTEAITGQDLVEWQFRVAAGERLPKLQDALAIDGHAVEVRLYAEDPARGFLPSVGRLVHLRLPGTARIESGVRAGDRITPDYDPMIAKLIVHGPDRAAALRLLSAALAASEVVGVQTNLALLSAIAAHPSFRAADFDTGFIARHPALLPPPASPPPLAIAAATLAVLDARAQTAHVETDPHSPWSATDCWRMNLAGAQTVHLRAGSDTFRIRAQPQADGAWQLDWVEASHVAAALPGTVRLDDAVHPATVVQDDGRITVVIAGTNHAFDRVDPLLPPEAEVAGGGRVMAPIPGRVASVLVKPGDTVTRGQPLVVLEAMKMELTLTSAMDGAVKAVRCAVGDMVQEGVDLVDFVLEPTE
ncbi:acetyl/propionyl/methylcrotonyl-CoA carboxylase subunit alpha [Limobrevibacterium gyesilva]|uniref:Acetyl/propionyl/methylcrotonyl-CoA carboxylase subunit alpha n=1 Tax=Limobrevibacterium gyesilva TaxID=2991712 RepID=A0AA42CHC8_9PROT|nr:acetyl/propionyl/methylcrotonyl-CoA carboxylase subunit alpha [Limobrevibacterium gyesilva]MCW3477121.1 acetyl/propionyl/methylcrotonyl-CoA carboxylase subunit alpha [Limobrevibacterium gyesilva]